MNDPSLDHIEITATVSNLPEETREMLRKTKADRGQRRESVFADLAVSLLPVEKPHRIVAPTARELRKVKPDQFGCVSATGAGMCGAIAHVDRAERVIAFLHAFATALDADGLQLQPDGTRM